MSYHSSELAKAFLAAVNATGKKEKEPNDGEDSFLDRLNIHSARLGSNGSDSVANDDHFTVFSSPNNHDGEVQADQKINEQESGSGCESRKSIGESRISIELSPVSISKLGQLFDDGEKLTENVSAQVNLPIWVCELLFKAVRKMPISDSLREEYERINELRTYCNLVTPFQRSNKKENISLTRLYEMFPTLSKKIIHQVAKEKDFDFEEAALYLVDYPDEQPIEVPTSAKPSIIVQSDRPQVILAKKQHAGTEMTQNNHKKKAFSLPISLNGWDLEVQDVEKELRKIEAEQIHCREMTKRHAGFRNWAAVSGFFSTRVNDLELAKRRLTNYWDRLRIWRTSSEECIDLHEMSVDRALSTVIEKINICREKHPTILKLYVITGYGKTTGVAKIKHRLLTFLKGKGIEARVSPRNKGVVELSLRNICARIE